MWRWFDHRIYFDKDNGAGGSGAQPGGNQPDPTAGLQSLLAKQNGDAAGVAGMLYQENYQHRERIRQLTADLEALKAKVPAEGHVVIKPEEAQELAAFRKLGKPDDLGKLQSELLTVRRDALLADVAGAHGYKVAVLKRLAGSELNLELRDVDKDGKKVRRAVVLEDGGKATDLEEYAKAQWAEFMPALPAATQAQDQPARQPVAGTPNSPKPAAAAGAGQADEEARAQYARTIRNW